MRIVPFLPAHLEAFEAQPAQTRFLSWMEPEAIEVAAAHFALTGLDDAGAVIGCAGLAPLNGDDVLTAWAVLSDRIAAHAVGLTRAAKRGLDLHRGHRIEAYVAEDHARAAAFAERLEFKLVGRARHPNGEDVRLYAREL